MSQRLPLSVTQRAFIQAAMVRRMREFDETAEAVAKTMEEGTMSDPDRLDLIKQNMEWSRQSGRQPYVTNDNADWLVAEVERLRDAGQLTVLTLYDGQGKPLLVQTFTVKPQAGFEWFSSGEDLFLLQRARRIRVEGVRP
jgi:hypothetical protein